MEKEINLKPLKFSAQIDLVFWTELSRRKLDEWKLDDKPKEIIGKYKVNNFNDHGRACLWFDSSSFNLKENEEGLNSGPLEIK